MIREWIRERRLPWEEVARPPRLPSLWLTIAWFGFLAGVFVVIFSMLAIGGEADEKACARAWLFWVMFPAFVVASLHTVGAALSLSHREKRIRAKIGHHAHHGWEGKVDSHPGGRSIVKEKDDLGRMVVQSDSGMPGKWSVTVGGDYLPAPYWSKESPFELQFDYKDYIELLSAETHAARTSAAKIAAAYGGLFLAAVNVYGRLVA